MPETLLTASTDHDPQQSKKPTCFTVFQPKTVRPIPLSHRPGSGKRGKRWRSSAAFTARWRADDRDRIGVRPVEIEVKSNSIRSAESTAAPRSARECRWNPGARRDHPGSRDRHHPTSTTQRPDASVGKCSCSAGHGSDPRTGRPMEAKPRAVNSGRHRRPAGHAGVSGAQRGPGLWSRGEAKAGIFLGPNSHD